MSFLCKFSVEDCERNDGSAEKPYFMSSGLMKILGKQNEVARDRYQWAPTETKSIHSLQNQWMKLPTINEMFFRIFKETLILFLLLVDHSTKFNLFNEHIWLDLFLFSSDEVFFFPQQWKLKCQIKWNVNSLALS